MIEIDQRVFIEIADPANHPSAQVWIPKDYTLTGGGTFAPWAVKGCLLTASFPLRRAGETDFCGWEARAKDHLSGNDEKSPLAVYAIGIRVFKDGRKVQLDQDVVEAKSAARVNHPRISVSLNNSEAVLTGGGAFVDWHATGNLLTASFPSSSDGGQTYSGWEARAKDHEVADPAIITAYAIGLEVPNREVKLSQKVVVFSSTDPVSHPKAEAWLSESITLTGGGGIDNWDGAGNLLTALYPLRRPESIGYNGWQARGKDHKTPDISTITCFAIGIIAS